MGALFVVEQISTGKLRALKLMHRELVYDPASRQRFEQEARIGARIASAHVVEVQSAGVDAQTQLPFLVMELLEGETLAARIARGPIPLAEASAILEQIAHALGAANDAGVVHRDLKPDNVFLATPRLAGGARLVVKILDFGIAKVVDDRRRTTGALGTPLWLAPEQTRAGEITPAADVWAFALVAFATLTGHVLWRAGEGPSASLPNLISEILHAPIPSATDRARECAVRLPERIDAWFFTALARDPQARFSNVRAAWTALAPLLVVDDVPLRPSAEPLARGKGAIVAMIAIIGFALAFAVALGVVFVARRAPSARAATNATSAHENATSASPSAPPAIAATAPGAPSAATSASSDAHVAAFFTSRDGDLQDDGVRRINETLGAELDHCLAEHPHHATSVSVVVSMQVAADGSVAHASMFTMQPHPTIQCMIDKLKATKFVARKKASEASVLLSWHAP